MTANQILDELVRAQPRAEKFVGNTPQLRLKRAEMCLMSGELVEAEKQIRWANEQILYEEIWDLACGYGRFTPEIGMHLHAHRYDEALALIIG